MASTAQLDLPRTVRATSLAVLWDQSLPEPVPVDANVQSALVGERFLAWVVNGTSSNDALYISHHPRNLPVPEELAPPRGP